MTVSSILIILSRKHSDYQVANQVIQIQALILHMDHADTYPCLTKALTFVSILTNFTLC